MTKINMLHNHQVRLSDKEYEDRFIKGLDLQFQGETLYLGANVFIYAAVRGDEKGEAAGKLIKAIASAEMGKNIAFTSTLVLDEVLWILTRRVDRIFAAREVKRILSFPNLTIVSVNVEHFSKAIEIFENYNVRPRDAIHAAVTLDLRTSIVSDDSDFDKIEGLKRIKL